MASRTALTLLSAAIGMALAQTTTVMPILLPDLAGPRSTGSFVGSVISADSAATAYAVNCANPGSISNASNTCIFPQGFTVRQGPSVWELHVTESDTLTYSSETQPISFAIDASCSIKSELNCMITSVGRTGTGASATGGTEIRAVVIPSASSFIQSVTITGGVEKLDGASTRAPATTTTPASTGGPGATGAGSSTTSTHNAGPRVTQQAVLAGVAAVVGGALLV